MGMIIWIVAGRAAGPPARGTGDLGYPRSRWAVPGSGDGKPGLGEISRAAAADGGVAGKNGRLVSPDPPGPRNDDR